ncbi:integrase_H2C2 domain-containing protein [Trichonephila clavipes]|nr:integrase_H2C2 domain-containing protein [Trichonephila clavipes]
MQEIWEYGLGWDEQLPTELKNKWETWCSQVCLLNDLTLERKYFPYPLDKEKYLQLHIFCDASPRAFGAVAYFRKASNYKQFVSNRVIENPIKFDPSDWHHYCGRENPADYVSRGANLETIINSQFWMHGPQWLRTTENNWPKKLEL